VPITINEEELLDLLEDCLDLLHYGQNGEYGAEQIAKVEYVLKLSGRKVPQYNEDGHRIDE